MSYLAVPRPWFWRLVMIPWWGHWADSEHLWWAYFVLNERWTVFLGSWSVWCWSWCPIVFLSNGLTDGDWLEAGVFALSVGVGLTPEMLPMIITASPSKRFYYRWPKEKVVIKKLNAIQDLGAIDILCTDKTGTLTQDEIVLNIPWTSTDAWIWLSWDVLISILIFKRAWKIWWTELLSSGLKRKQKNTPSCKIWLKLFKNRWASLWFWT